MRKVVVCSLLFLMAGCTTTFRAEVDPAVLSQSSLEWDRTVVPSATGGAFGASVEEIDYMHVGDPSPPYSGLVQVFTLDGDTRSSTQLLAAARAAVENVTAERHIEVEGDEETGERVLRDGVRTRYFVVEGLVESSGGLFPRDARVRILGEAGFDSKSGVSIVVIALSQIGIDTTCPIVGPCGSTTDFRTWNEIAGDPAGTIGGAKSDVGLVYNLVTHDK